MAALGANNQIGLFTSERILDIGLLNGPQLWPFVAYDTIRLTIISSLISGRCYGSLVMDGVGKVSWFLGKYDARGPPGIELRRSCPKAHRA